MQVLHAGTHKLLFLELETQLIDEITSQLGYQCRIRENKRAITLDLLAPDRTTPLLLFDAAEPGNLGWFSRCQFYVDGRTSAVLQTPFTLANQRDRSGHILPNAIRLQISRELPESFRTPTRQPVNEQLIYTILYNFLNALQNSGVALCGSTIVKPLTGRSEASPR
jgi:hypothetical protein